MGHIAFRCGMYVFISIDRRVHSVIRSEGRAEVQTLNHKEGAEPEDCRADRMRRVSHTIHERRDKTCHPLRGRFCSACHKPQRHSLE